MDFNEQAIGTGGRDLSEKVGAPTFRQGIDLLARDPETKVIVLISKPPSASVARIKPSLEDVFIRLVEGTER